MLLRFYSFIFILLLSAPNCFAQFTVKLDNPRDTMRTFMSAMADYRRGVSRNDEELKGRISDAVRCLHLPDTPYVLRDEKGKEIAILLKEVIDRMIVVDYQKIPEDTGNAEDPLLRWRLKNTEIVIARMNEGEKAGEYLFTADTAYRAQSFYQKVKHLPYKEGSGGGAFYKEPWLDRVIPAWAKTPFFGLPKWQWLALFVSVLIGLIIKTLFQFVLKSLSRMSEKATQNSWRYWKFRAFRSVENSGGLLAATIFWFVSIYILKFEGAALLILTNFIQVLLSISLIWSIYKLADVLTEYLQLLANRTESTLDDQLVPLLTKSIKVFVVIFGSLITLQSMGFNVMSVLAGLGLGGLAFALAAKDTCANLFGSIMIFMDQPFRIGDWIIVDDKEGTVEEIGFRTTRLRTFYNSVIAIPNSIVANCKVDNMGMRQYRRAIANLGIGYDTPAEKIEAFLEGIKNIIKANPHTRKDYYHVVFKGFGSFDLQIMVYFFLKVPNWNDELVEKQNIFLEILRLAEKLEIDFAFPTETLHIESFPEKKSLMRDHTFNTADLQQKAKMFGPNGQEARSNGLGLFTAPHRE